MPKNPPKSKSKLYQDTDADVLNLPGMPEDDMIASRRRIMPRRTTSSNGSMTKSYVPENSHPDDGEFADIRRRNPATKKNDSQVTPGAWKTKNKK